MGTSRSDGDIEQDIGNEFLRDVLLSGIPIDFSVAAGSVTLTGNVNSFYQKDLAEEKVRSVDGVKHVDNQIVVVPQAIVAEAGVRLTDAEVSKSVRQELVQDPRVAADGISVKVTAGSVTLAGTVSSLSQKQIAERITRRVIGVLRVDNQLQVITRKRPDAEIHRDIAAAFSSDATLRGQQVGIAVRDGQVTLVGELKDFTSKAQAARLAARVQNVHSVINETRVTASARLPDSAITTLVTDRLKSNATVRDVADRIRVETAGGAVTLSGNVKTWSQYAEASRAASLTDGVRTVTNQLKVTGP